MELRNVSSIHQEFLIFIVFGKNNSFNEGVWVHLCGFLDFFYKGEQLFWLPVYFPGGRSPSNWRSTLKGKNFLLEEQILSSEREPKIKRVELISLRVCLFTLVYLSSCRLGGHTTSKRRCVNVV